MNHPIKTADEIKAALERAYDSKDPDYLEKARAREHAQQELVYAQVLARFGRAPDQAWTDPTDPRLLAWREVLETEVRVSVERLSALTDYRSKGPLDTGAVRAATDEVAALVEKLARVLPRASSQTTPKTGPSLEDAQAIPLAGLEKANGAAAKKAKAAS